MCRSASSNKGDPYTIPTLCLVSYQVQDSTVTSNPDGTTCHPHLQGGVVRSDGWQVLDTVHHPKLSA